MFKKRSRDEDVPSFLGRVAKTLEMPVDVAEGLPQIELLGNREAVIEHCQSVLEYNDRVVRLHTGKLLLKITGRSLRMDYMTGDIVKVQGRFSSFEFSIP